MFTPGISSVPCSNVYLVLALNLRKIQPGFWTAFIFSNILFQHIVVPTRTSRPTLQPLTCNVVDFLNARPYLGSETETF